MATEIFFSVATWKNVVAKKCQLNFSFAAKHKPKFLVARWKILVANFSFKNQSEENALGAAMAIYTPTTEKLRRTNRIPAIYAVS